MFVILQLGFKTLNESLGSASEMTYIVSGGALNSTNSTWTEDSAATKTIVVWVGSF